MWPTRAERDDEERARWRFLLGCTLGWLPCLIVAAGVTGGLVELGVPPLIGAVVFYPVLAACFWVIAFITGLTDDPTRKPRSEFWSRPAVRIGMGVGLVLLATLAVVLMDTFVD